MINCFRSAWGTPPPPLGGHSATHWVCEDDSYLLVFGGNADLSQDKADDKDKKNVLINSIYLFKTRDMRWRQIEPTGELPVPRYCHSATLFDVGDYEQILIYGGFSRNKALGDTWLLLPGDEPTEWVWAEVKEQEGAPPPRYGHSLDLVRDKLIMFGGSTGSEYLNDLYLLEVDEEMCIWRPINTQGPSPRAYHASVYIEWEEHHCLVVFGGRTSDATCTNDIFVLCFNFVENTVFWMQPECAGQPPSPRYNHTMVAIENKIYVFGGRTINADGTKTTLNDLYMLNLDTLTWHRPSTAGMSPLPARCWHTCTSINGLMYVIGGYSDTATFGDVHVLDSNARFKLPNRSEKSIQNLSGFQASFTDLTKLGPRSLTSSDSRARLLGSVDSLATMLHKKKMSKQDVATTVLDLLRDNFVMIEQYNYEWDQPSHEWIGNKIQFLELIEPLCKQVKEILMKEPILVATSSPSYILGDLHANYKDLMFFARNFWGFGLKLCPANILFLGDYVDRGPHSVEVIIYLFALKVLHPKKVILLRGNHEFRDVNGDMELYESTSFKSQCIALGGKAIGLSIWEAVNSCFDWMPLASIMDKKIFCVHGGIPRYTQSSTSNLLHDIASISRPVTEETLWLDQTNQMPFTFDLVWADPAEPTEEAQLSSQKKLFAENERGGNTVIFSRLALEEFFRKTGCSYVVRAHQRKDLGVEITKGAKVLTVFSSSHYCFSESTQILTNHGFMSLQDMLTQHYDANSLQLKQGSDLLVCAYDAASQSLVYQRSPTLIVNEAGKYSSMVQFRSKETGVEIVATPDHDMYARVLSSSSSSSQYRKAKAGDILANGNADFEFLARATNGVAVAQKEDGVSANGGGGGGVGLLSSVVGPLQIATEGQLEAFLALVGFVVMRKSRNEEGVDLSFRGTLVQLGVDVQQASHLLSSTGGHSLPGWWRELSADQARALLRGVVGSGSECGASVVVSSIALRDELVQLALHAGLSSDFVAVSTCAWRVRFDEATVSVALSSAEHVKDVAYNGRTWCVRVPAGLIVVRNAVVDERGFVVEASRPTIQGNCGGHNSAAAVLVADDKLKVVIVQPYQQVHEPPEAEQLYMAVGAIDGREDDDRKQTRDWGTTAPDPKDKEETGIALKREMVSSSSDGVKVALAAKKNSKDEKK